MSFDKSLRIGESPFARKRDRDDATPERRKSRFHTGMREAIEPPRLWALAQNTRQSTAGDVNRLNLRDPLTSSREDGMMGHGDAVAKALTIFGSPSDTENG